MHHFENKQVKQPKCVHSEPTQLENDKCYAAQDATCQLDRAIQLKLFQPSLEHLHIELNSQVKMPSNVMSCKTLVVL